MVLLARSLGRSARMMVRGGPIALPYRPFSVSAPTFMPEDPPDPPKRRDIRPQDLPDAPEYSPDLLPPEERTLYDLKSPEEREQFDAEQHRLVEQYNNPKIRKEMFADLDAQVQENDKTYPLRPRQLKPNKHEFFAVDEDDEFSRSAEEDDEFHDDEMTSMAHAELELHREVREYARITAWDMPFLSKLAKPFTLPPETHVLRFRYTTYMGESHPAEHKVVVEFSSQDFVPRHLTEAQRQTLLKLVGPRYNPDTDIVRMSCEKFQTRAQNKRYLGDIVDTLLKEAKEGDSFADLPLDLRHHKPKKTYPFPKSWALTEERKQQLEADRAERKRLEKERQRIVDGNKVVAHALEALPAYNPGLQQHARSERERVAVNVGARGQKPVQRPRVR